MKKHLTLKITAACAILTSVMTNVDAADCICSFIPVCVGTEKIEYSEGRSWIEWKSVLQPLYTGSVVCANGQPTKLGKKYTCERTVTETFSQDYAYSGNFTPEIMGVVAGGRLKFDRSIETRAEIELSGFCQCCQIGNSVNCTEMKYYGFCNAPGCTRMAGPVLDPTPVPSPCKSPRSGVVVTRTDEYPSVLVDMDGNGIPDCRETPQMKACKTTCDIAGGSGLGGV